MRNFLLTAALLVALPSLADDAGAPPASDSVAELWRAKCKNCHGEDGRGKTKVGKAQKIDDFSDAGWQQRHSDEKIEKVIRKGIRGTKMKAYEGKLTDEEIGALVQYIRTLQAK